MVKAKPHDGKHLDLPGQPYVQVFEVVEGSLMMGESLFTSVVIDRDGFELLLQELARHRLSTCSQQEWNDAIDRFRHLGNIPLIGRGTKTEWLFEKFEVTTKIMGVIVRGEAEDVLVKMGLVNPSQAN